MEGNGVVAISDDDLTKYATLMSELFRGREDAYIQTTLTGAKRADGKVESKTVVIRRPITLELWKGHLLGTVSIGVFPLRTDQNVHWGAIDLDVYSPTDTNILWKKINDLGLNLICTKSKSGGLHVWLFLRQVTPAVEVRKFLLRVIRSLGLSPKTEMFPKQDTIDIGRGDVGNAINIPYYFGLSTDPARLTRYYVKGENGEQGSLDEFLQRATSIVINVGTLHDHSKPVEAIEATEPIHTAETHPFDDGPPCLEHMATTKIKMGGRSNALFHTAVFARKKKEAVWQDYVKELNKNFFEPPLTDEEVNKTIKSLEKKTTYNYICHQEPMRSNCNRALCLMRKFGITGVVEISGVVCLRDKNQSTWYASLNGVRTTLGIKDLTNQARFRDKAADVIQVLPERMSGPGWDSYIQEVLKNAQCIDVPQDVADESLVLDGLQAYVYEQGSENKLNLIHYQRPWIDADRRQVVLSFNPFFSYLHRNELFRQARITATQLAQYLDDLGGKAVEVMRKTRRAIPFTSVPGISEFLVRAHAEQEQIPLLVANGDGVEVAEPEVPPEPVIDVEAEEINDAGDNKDQ